MTQKQKERIAALKKEIRKAKREFDDAETEWENAESYYYCMEGKLNDLKHQLAELTVIKRIRDKNKAFITSKP